MRLLVGALVLGLLIALAGVGIAVKELRTSDPEGRDGLVIALGEALAAEDAESLTDLVSTSEYLCDPADVLAAVPTCSGKAAGTPVQVVRWNLYCTACDAFGYATLGELTDWVEDFFASTETAPNDEFGASRLTLLEGTDTGLVVSATGIADPDLFGYPRRLGRWVVTFHLEARGDERRITSLTLADPDASSWVLSELTTR